MYKKDGFEKLFTHKRYRIAIIVNRRLCQKSPGSSRPLKVNNYNNFKAFRKKNLGLSENLWIDEKSVELLINQLNHLNGINYMSTWSKSTRNTCQARSSARTALSVSTEKGMS